MVKKKQAEDYVEKKGLFGIATDYHVYHMTRNDYLTAWVIGFLSVLIVMYVFFGNIVLAVVSGIGAMKIMPRYYREFRKKRRLNELRLQFKDLLESLTVSYSAGLNTVDAFSCAANDMVSIYGEGADIVKEVKTICSGLENNINIEELLLDFAARSSLDDVMSFANVFEVCNRQGSDLKRVVEDTREIINDKIEVEMEIETMLSGNKNELNIMMVMPLVIVVMLKGLGSGTITTNSLSNIVIKLICLVTFALAYVIGRKIIDIKI